MRASTLHLLAALALPFVAACGSAPVVDDSETDDQAVGVNVAALRPTEAGRFYREGRREGLVADGTSVPSLRFNAFGDTRVRIEVTGPGAPVAVLVGPLPSDDRTVVLRRVGRGGRTVVEATVAQPGAYRLMVGARDNFAGREGVRGTYAVSFACTSGCAPKQILLDDAVRGLATQVGEDKVAEGLDRIVDGVLPDGDARAALKTELRGAVARRAMGTAPVVPVRALGEMQALFEQVPRSFQSPNDNGRHDVDLDTVGADCVAPREAPAVVTPSLPGVTRGHAPDHALDDCMLARLRGLTTALNAVSMKNDSVATMQGKSLTTPGEVAAALLDAGHTIRVENTRFIADFLGLNVNGVSVMAPVWLDTGIPLPAGGTLRIPSPHAQHNLWIEGPRFRGLLKFYMGVPAGIRFKVQETITPEWDGGPDGTGRVEYAFDAASERAAVLQTFDDAGTLRRRWTADGAGRPLDGYGQIGVCTDSTAYLEHRRTGQATLFPLLHPRPAEVRDDVDRAMAALPSDGGELDREDALRRIARSFPTMPAESPFRAFADGMRALGR